MKDRRLIFATRVYAFLIGYVGIVQLTNLPLWKPDTTTIIGEVEYVLILLGGIILGLTALFEEKPASTGQVRTPS